MRQPGALPVITFTTSLHSTGCVQLLAPSRRVAASATAGLSTCLTRKIRKCGLWCCARLRGPIPRRTRDGVVFHHVAPVSVERCSNRVGANHCRLVALWRSSKNRQRPAEHIGSTQSHLIEAPRPRVLCRGMILRHRRTMTHPPRAIMIIEKENLLTPFSAVDTDQRVLPKRRGDE